MEEKEEEDGEEGRQATTKQMRAQAEHNDGVVGKRNDCSHEKDHQVSQEFEARAQLETVDGHYGRAFSLQVRGVTEAEIEPSGGSTLGAGREQALPDVRSQRVCLSVFPKI